MDVSNPMKYLDFITKIPTSLVFTLTTGVGLCIFLPENIADKLSILQFRNTYTSFLGPSFIALLSVLVFKVLNVFRKVWYNRKLSKIRESYLHTLTPEEQGYLSQFINGRENSVYCDMRNGIIGGLITKKIVYQGSTVGTMLDGFAYNFQPWAREYLSKHPELLSEAVGRPTTERDRIYGY